MSHRPALVDDGCTVPLWWVLMRDTALLLVGLGGILYEHITPEDARPLIVITDLVLIGLIPLGHLLMRVPRAHFTLAPRQPEPEPQPLVVPPGAFDPRTEGPS
jgi:hypothetical protein